MAHEVTPALVRATASLARLALPDDAVAPLVQALSAIVTHVATLREADPAARPTPADPPRCPLREDVVVAGISHESVKAMAPVFDPEGYVVPRAGEP